MSLSKAKHLFFMATALGLVIHMASIFDPTSDILMPKSSSDNDDNDSSNDSSSSSFLRSSPPTSSENDNDLLGPATSGAEGTDQSWLEQDYDVCCVGAGLSGGVIAERYASQLGKKVLIVEKRDHIGGNCFDYHDAETSILVNKYGAHLFHTVYDRVWQYVQQFSEWTPYEHRVAGYINKKHVPIPVNIDTVNQLFGLSVENPDEMNFWLNKERRAYGNSDKEPENSEEMAISRVGKRLYELIFHPYTIKQWAKEPAELGPEVTARIPVRDNYDDRYFGDIYQALPSKGYTNFFKSLLNHSLITTKVNVDYFQIRSKMKCGKTYFTGPIDVYFSEMGMDRLEYRSLDFERGVSYNTKFLQPLSVVNHPSADVPFTRIVEYKHYLNQENVSPHTVYFMEHSKDGGEPYYPVPNERNQELYKKYQDLALNEGDHIRFVGRLANYKYFNMDQSIKNALELFDEDTGHPPEDITITTSTDTRDWSLPLETSEKPTPSTRQIFVVKSSDNGEAFDQVASALNSFLPSELVKVVDATPTDDVVQKGDIVVMSANSEEECPTSLVVEKGAYVYKWILDGNNAPASSDDKCQMISSDINMVQTNNLLPEHIVRPYGSDKEEDETPLSEQTLLWEVKSFYFSHNVLEEKDQESLTDTKEVTQVGL